MYNAFVRLRVSLVVAGLILALACAVLASSCFLEPQGLFKTGTIVGSVELPASVWGSSPEVYIYIQERPGFMQRVGADGKFVVTGLDEEGVYTLTFTTRLQGVVRADGGRRLCRGTRRAWRVFRRWRATGRRWAAWR